jgi:DNA (cytosine-5)-methyltransferase 1
LRKVRTEYGKSIRKKYESGEIKISRHKFIAYEIREDGISNTISTVTKDNMITVFAGLSKKENGMYIEMPGGFYAYCVWHEKYQCYIAIRKLTPKECFRLQGWTDDYFEKAKFVNSDSQLYKQAGNGVTVNVVRAIGDKMTIRRNG